MDKILKRPNLVDQNLRTEFLFLARVRSVGFGFLGIRLRHHMPNIRMIAGDEQAAGGATSTGTVGGISRRFAQETLCGRHREKAFPNAGGPSQQDRVGQLSG